VSLLDPAERTRTGVKTQTEITGAEPREPATLFESSWRDFVFAEVWTRPGLDRRSRFFIAIAGATCVDGPGDKLEGFIRGALTLGEATLAELREASLHLATYAGWGRGAILDAAITRVAEALNLPPAPFTPLRAAPWDPEVRLADGAAGFQKVMVMPGPPPVAPYYTGGILNFVFGEMWTRPGLDERARRWITLVGVGESSTDIPIRSHVHAAMASGNATPEEMGEFVLQYATHAGWPRGSEMQAAVFEMIEKVKKGLPFNA
jgi:4-carboxymuconolactone decarboxylase